MSYPLTSQMAKAYQDLLAEEVERDRRIEALDAAGAHLQEWILMGAGDFLISVGQRLLARYEPALSSGPKAGTATARRASA
ncbi:MAG TPA: hypothetical protein VLY63_09445 [Anaerolineae bacterium]|nr:hypothetical protein [Anaerolineae bacterium]